MRSMLALGILVVMFGVAGPPICDSGCVAHAEDARPPLKKSDRLPIRTERRLVSDWAPESYWRYIPEYMPRLEFQRQRGPLRGDFWTDDEIRRIFDSR